MYTPQESAQILQYRAKVNAGTHTKEELTMAMALLRRARGQAHTTSAIARGKKAAAKAPIDSNAMLNELEGL